MGGPSGMLGAEAAQADNVRRRAIAGNFMVIRLRQEEGECRQSVCRWGRFLGNAQDPRSNAALSADAGSAVGLRTTDFGYQTLWEVLWLLRSHPQVEVLK